MRLLAAGGAGFIGSNFIHHLLKSQKEVEVVNFDKLTYAGNLDNLTSAASDPRYHFVQGDIVEAAKIDEVIEEYQPEAIVNFAAATHVDRSIHGDKKEFILSNVLGAQVLAEAVRRHRLALFIQISTDEVFGSLGLDEKRSFDETTPFAPNSPYAAAKAGGDLICRAYVETFKTPIIVTHATNNYGSYQFPEKFIPQAIIRALADEPIPIYGDGLYVRDWLQVSDHARAIALLLGIGSPGEVYNIGADNERSNLEVMRLLLALLGKPETLLSRVEDRPGHDRRYSVNSAKIRKLGWEPHYPKENFEAGLREKIEWYQANQIWLARLAARQIEINPHIKMETKTL